MGNRGANPSGHILENKPAKQDIQKKTSSLSTFFVCVFNFEKMKILWINGNSTMEIILMSVSDYVREWRRLMKNEGWTYFFLEACPVL